jgi:hypothetical protein
MTDDTCPKCGAARNTGKRGTTAYRAGTWACGSTQVSPTCTERSPECLLKSELILEGKVARLKAENERLAAVACQVCRLAGEACEDKCPVNGREESGA